MLPIQGAWVLSQGAINISHMPHITVKIQSSGTKTQYSQINKYIYKKKNQEDFYKHVVSSSCG